MMLPIVATVASPMPESAAKIAQANTVIIPSAPVLCPNNSRPRLTSFVDIQPSGIKSLARVKNRTASRVYGLAEVTYVGNKRQQHQIGGYNSSHRAYPQREPNRNVKQQTYKKQNQYDCGCRNLHYLRPPLSSFSAPIFFLISPV